MTTYAVSFASFAALSFALGITSFTMPIWLPVVVGSGLVGSWYASLTASDGALPADQTVERLRVLDGLDARLADAVSAIGLAAG